MNSKPFKHEDDRRILTEWIKDIPFKRAKVLETKGDTPVTLGKHYHEKSDSVFYILKGKGSYVLNNVPGRAPFYDRGWLFEGESLFVERGIVHTFELLPGTIMLEAASEPYEANDEIQVS